MGVCPPCPDSRLGAAAQQRLMAAAAELLRLDSQGLLLQSRGGQEWSGQQWNGQERGGQGYMSPQPLPPPPHARGPQPPRVRTKLRKRDPPRRAERQRRRQPRTQEAVEQEEEEEEEEDAETEAAVMEKLAEIGVCPQSYKWLRGFFAEATCGKCSGPVNNGFNCAGGSHYVCFGCVNRVPA